MEKIKQEIEISVNEKGTAETTKKVGQLNESISQTTSENKKSEEGFKSLKLQLREAVVDQQKLAQQYGATSEQAIKAAKAVAGIKDEIGLQKQLVDSYNPDDKFRGLTQTAGIASLALGGVSDGFRALGIESKVLDQIVGSAQAILGVTSAVSGMSDAYAVLTASKRAKSAAEVVEAGTTEALVIANTQATATTWTWNAALLANPIVLIAAGIVAAGAAIYAFVKITGDAVKAEEKAKVASMQLEQAIDHQAKAFEKNSESNRKNNDFKIALLRASGASEAQIYKETKALADQELQLAKNFRAQAIILEQKAYNANRENPTEFNAATLKSAEENLQKAKDAVSTGYDGLIDLQNNHEVAKVQAETDARNKRIEAAKKEADDKKEKINQANKDELALMKKNADSRDAQYKKSKEDAEKIVKDLELAVETPKEKEDREYLEKKFALEGHNLETQELTRQHLLALAEIDRKDKEEKANKDFEYWKAESDASIKATEESNRKILEEEKLKNEAIQISRENLNKVISGLEESGLNKTKAGQVASKAIALTQIGIDSAVALGNATKMANAEGVAAQVALPFVPGIGTAARIVSYAGTALSVFSNIKRAKALLSGGSGGGGVSGGGGTPAQPQRNTAQVGFQGSSENQIGNAVANSQTAMPPIQAFVVSQAVTDANEIERKKLLNNSF